MFDNDMSDDEKELMDVTLLSYDQPQVFAPGKPAQPGFGPVADKLGDDRPALSQFISERSWLLFERAKPYLRLTHPGEVPDNTAAPNVGDEFTWLQELSATWMIMMSTYVLQDGSASFN